MDAHLQPRIARQIVITIAFSATGQRRNAVAVHERTADAAFQCAAATRDIGIHPLGIIAAIFGPHARSKAVDWGN